MACIHLKHLFELCQQNQLKISGPELVRIVCTQCGVQEECPAMLMEEYDRRHQGDPPAEAAADQAAADQAAADQAAADQAGADQAGADQAGADQTHGG